MQGMFHRQERKCLDQKKIFFNKYTLVELFLLFISIYASTIALSVINGKSSVVVSAIKVAHKFFPYMSLVCLGHSLKFKLRML